MKIKKSDLLRLIRENISFLFESTLSDMGNIITLNSPVILIHRTDNRDLTYDMLNPMADRTTRQSRGGKISTVGLYAYEKKNDVPRYGDNKIKITLPIGTKILDMTEAGRGKTSRVSRSDAEELLKNEISAIVGYDFLGPPEWVILKMP